MRASFRSLAVVFFVIAAGCASNVPRGDDGGAQEVEAAPETRSAFFTSEMALAPEAPPETSGVGAGSFFLAWSEGRDYPTWEDAPVATDVRVENITSTLFLRSTGPVVETVRFPDVMIYAGAGGAFMGFASAKFASVLVPGEVYEVPLALTTPAGGLFIPAGERLSFKVVPVMHQNDAADVEILVGGDAASTVAWLETPATSPEDLTLTHGDAAGEATGSAYAGDAAPESVRHLTVVPTTSAPRAFLVWMNTTDHTGVPDIDLSLEGPDGAEIAFSGTPTPREFLRLGAANLHEAGDYTIVVTSYGSARATFTVEWLVG